MFGFGKAKMVTADGALQGREQPMGGLPTSHAVLGHALQEPFPNGLQTAVVGMGCFWGAERAFWKLPGVWTTAVGYTAGFTPNPTYEEVCSGKTGHNEVVLVVFDAAQLPFEQLLAVFFESHDPTQGMRQGNDRGTQYRSGIYVTDDQRAVAERVRDVYAERLKAAGLGAVTSEVVDRGAFYYAEAYHQQYLAKNPGGYCGLGGTGVSCPIGVLENG